MIDISDSFCCVSHVFKKSLNVTRCSSMIEISCC